MHRSISLAGCLALLTLPAGSVQSSAATFDHPVILASASGGISGTGGFNDTGNAGSASGSAIGDVNDTTTATSPNGNNTNTQTARTHHQYKTNGSSSNSNANGNYGPGSGNGSSNGNGAYSGPNGTSGATH